MHALPIPEPAPPPSDQPPLVNRVSGRRLLIALLVWALLFGVSFGLLIVLARFVRIALVRDHLGDASALLLLAGYVALLVGLLVGFGGVRGLRERLGFRFTSVRDLALALGLWLACLFAGGLLAIPLTQLFGRPENNAVEVLSRLHDRFSLLVVVVTAIVLAPAAEEMLFRGALFGWLRLRIPVFAAGLLSAALFAGAHVAPLLFPYLFLFGLAAAFIYQRTGSTLNSFAMHACQNTLAVLSALALVAGGGP